MQAGFTQWSISYSDKPLEVLGRVLAPEQVFMDGDNEFRYGVPFNSKTANFEREMRSKKILDLGNVERVADWLIIVGKRNEANAQEFARMLSTVVTLLGMPLSKPRIEVLYDDRASAFSAALNSKVNNAMFVVCIVPNNDKARYDMIKKYCYLQKGIASQVVVARTLSKKQQLMSVCTKVGIQVATKLGAVPWAFKIPPKNLMVIRFDTYHDSARKGGICWWSRCFSQFDVDSILLSSCLPSDKRGNEFECCQIVQR